MRKLIKRKGRKARILYFLSAGILLFGLAAFGIFSYEKQKEEAYEAELNLLRQKLEGTQKTVYVAAEDLQRGENAVPEKLYVMEYCSDLPEDWFLPEDGLGKELRVEVKAGTPLLAAMVADAEDGGRREVFLSSVQMEEFMGEGDRVDVRIVYPNGEDYVVLADKELLLCGESGIVLLLNGREIGLLSSAMADEKQYPDTKLYAVRYPYGGQSEKSTVNYLPNEAVAHLLGQSEEKMRQREELEDRLLKKEREAW